LTAGSSEKALSMKVLPMSCELVDEAPVELISRKLDDILKIIRGAGNAGD
jgi:hypothetical protein